jgi:hypothetical protein
MVCPARPYHAALGVLRSPSTDRRIFGARRPWLQGSVRDIERAQAGALALAERQLEAVGPAGPHRNSGEGTRASPQE